MNNERTPKTVLQLIFKEGEDPTKTSRLETQEEVEKRIRRRKEDEAREIYKEKTTHSLNCDKCGEYICQVYESDLNGSRFYHRECLNK